MESKTKELQSPNIMQGAERSLAKKESIKRKKSIQSITTLATRNPPTNARYSPTTPHSQIEPMKLPRPPHHQISAKSALAHHTDDAQPHYLLLSEIDHLLLNKIIHLLNTA